MGVTKEEILKSASTLYKKQGFPSTSIQDIADDCCIAKGSIYKFFSSKEELFNEVFDQCQNNFFEEVEQIKQNSGLSKRDLFLQQIIFRFQYFIDNKFILVDLQEVPLEQNPKFMPLRLRVRARFMNWHKGCLLHVYGPDMEQHIGDLVIIYKALLREYLFWIMRDDNPLSIEETAAFIVNKIDILAQYFIDKHPRPLLTATSVAKYMNWGLEGQDGERKQVTKDLVETIQQTIKGLPVGQAYREELLEVLTMLKEEMAKKESKRSLIMALLTYLEKETDLKSLVKQLKNIIID